MQPSPEFPVLLAKLLKQMLLVAKEISTLSPIATAESARNECHYLPSKMYVN